MWAGAGSTASYFSAGADADGAYTVTVSGTLSPKHVYVLSGNPTFTGGQLNFSSTSTYASNYVASGSTATFNTPFGGTIGPDKWGRGTAVYNGASTVSSFYFTLNQGTIAIGNDLAFSTRPLVIGDVSGANVVTLKSADSTSHTLNNALTNNASSMIFGAGGDLTFSGPAIWVQAAFLQRR